MAIEIVDFHGFSHEKWWIFPWQNVSSPEGKFPKMEVSANHSIFFTILVLGPVVTTGDPP